MHNILRNIATPPRESKTWNGRRTIAPGKSVTLAKERPGCAAPEFPKKTGNEFRAKAS